MPGILPPESCAIITPAASDSAPTCFIGLAVFGERRALEALLQAARTRQIPGKVLDSEPLEAMVLFSGVARTDAFALFRDAVAGRFGQLKVEVVVAPASKAGDGLDMDGEITVESPQYLRSSE